MVLVFEVKEEQLGEVEEVVEDGLVGRNGMYGLKYDRHELMLRIVLCKELDDVVEG